MKLNFRRKPKPKVVGDSLAVEILFGWRRKSLDMYKKKSAEDQIFDLWRIQANLVYLYTLRLLC